MGKKLALILVSAALVTFGLVWEQSGATALSGPRNSTTVTYDAAANAACQPVKVYSQPPAGFNPLTASSAQLATYGFPPPPPGDNAGATSDWEAMVQGAKYYSDPQPICGSTTHAVYTGFWAGHVAPNSDYSGDHFTWSEATWIQPGVPGDASYPDADWQSSPDASFWDGIGVSSLVQAGADSFATTDPSYRFWTEDYPNNTIWEGPVISPGDAAFAYVSYISSSDCYYFLENNTSGSYQTFDNSCPYDGYGAANFINERVNGLYLPDFGTHATSGNYFGDGSNTYDLSSSKSNIYIVTSNCLSSGTVLSQPSSVASDTSYNNVWSASSPYTNGC